MALTLPSDIDFVKNKSADPARMNVAMLSLHSRLVALELPAKTIDDVLASIQQVGLERVNNALQPYYEQLAAVVSQYEALTQSQTISGGTLDTPVTRIANRRSTTAGDVPTDLVPGEIGINQADGLVFWKDALGVIQSTPLLDVITASILTPLLAAKAPLASPALTGVPTAPTATAGDISTTIANTSFVNTAVQAAISALLNGAPVALDTLKELADALGDDANYAATTATALGNRVRVDATQSFSTGQKHIARWNIASAAWEAMADRNIMYNHQCWIGQDLAGASVSVAPGTAPYVCDAWVVSNSSASTATYAARQVTNPFPTVRPDISNGVQATLTAAHTPASAENLAIMARLEGIRGRVLNWLGGNSNAAYLYVSFVVSVAVAGRYYVHISVNAASGSGSGGANRTYLLPVDLPATTGTLVEAIIPPPPVALSNSVFNDLTFRFIAIAGSGVVTAPSNAKQWLDTTSSGAFSTTIACSDIGNAFSAANGFAIISDLIMLPVVGNVDPTTVIPAERRPLMQRQWSHELATCERYYRKSYDIAVTPGTVTNTGALDHVLDGSNNFASLSAHFGLRMRAPPNVTIYSVGTGALGYIRNTSTNTDIPASIAAYGTTGFTAIVNNATVNTGQTILAHYVADARV